MRVACLLAEQDCWTRQASVVFRDSKQKRFSIFTRKSAKLTVNCRPVSTTSAQTQHARIPPPQKHARRRWYPVWHRRRRDWQPIHGHHGRACHHWHRHGPGRSRHWNCRRRQGHRLWLHEWSSPIHLRTREAPLVREAATGNRPGGRLTSGIVGTVGDKTQTSPVRKSHGTGRVLRCEVSKLGSEPRAGPWFHDKW